MSELPLPAEIRDALGELVGAARDGLLALSVGLRLTVVHQLMEAGVDQVDRPPAHAQPGPDGEAARPRFLLVVGRSRDALSDVAATVDARGRRAAM